MTAPSSASEPRPIDIQVGYLSRRPESVLYCSGDTHVLCCAALEAGVPDFLAGKGKGWATAEYSLMPGSTQPRARRERGKVSGRTQEIQRLIGRSLRGIIDFEALDGFTLQLDCDVLQADGGTRTASINGAYIAASIAFGRAVTDGRLERSPLRRSSGEIRAVGAMSAGVVGGRLVLDLDYEHDSAADVDLNLVIDEQENIIEIQGTAERAPLSRDHLDQLVDLGVSGIRKVFAAQNAAIDAALQM